MIFLLLGLLLVVLKFAAIGPVGDWSWWLVLSPFAVAAAWWQFADAVGLTKKREMDKMEARKQERRRKNLAQLGLDEQSRRGGK